MAEIDAHDTPPLMTHALRQQPQTQLLSTERRASSFLMKAGSSQMNVEVAWSPVHAWQSAPDESLGRDTVGGTSTVYYVDVSQITQACKSGLGEEKLHISTENCVRNRIVHKLSCV